MKRSTIEATRVSSLSSSSTLNLELVMSETTRQGCIPNLRRLMASILVHKRFDLCMGLIITANSVCIGWEQSYRIENRSTKVFEKLEHVFLVAYIIELSCRFFVLGCKALEDYWVKFDAFLVITSIFTEWILKPIVGGASVENASPLLVMRTARLARLARALRLLTKFRQLWMLVRGLLLSAKMVIYTLILLFIILYMFSAVAIELVRLDDSYTSPTNAITSQDYRRVVKEYFDTLPMTMMTLVQFVCMDSIGAIYKPLIQQRVLLAVYFMALILVVAVVLMNIVTAVLVNGALEQASQDRAIQKAEKEKKRKDLLASLYAMFARLDADASGTVSREELCKASQHDKHLLHEFMELKDPLEIFDQLDIHGVGTLEIDEFIQGMYESAISKSPIQLKRIDKRIDIIKKQQDQMSAHMEEVKSTMQELSAFVQGLGPLRTYTTSQADSTAHAFDRNAARQDDLLMQDAGEEPLSVGIEPSPRTPFVSAPMSTKREISCSAPQNSYEPPPWVAEILVELQQVQSSISRLGRECQKQFSSLRPGMPLQPLHPKSQCTLQSQTLKVLDVKSFAPDIGIEEPRLAPEVVHARVEVSKVTPHDRPLIMGPDKKNMLSQAIATYSEGNNATCLVDIEHMRVPSDADSFGIAQFHKGASAISSASRRH